MICGIDLDFGALRGELDKLKSEALGLLASTMADAKAALSAQMDAFESTVRGWIPELPDLPVSPGDPMLPELLALAAKVKDLESAVGEARTLLIAELAELRTEFESTYADAIAKAGSEIDSLISGLNGGIDPCSLVPNILKKPDGTVGEVPKIPLYAKTDPVAETPSEIAAPMVAQVKKIDEDLTAETTRSTAMTAAYEAKQTAVTEKVTSTKEALNKQEISRDTYYKETVTTVEETVDVVSEEHPSTAKQSLENTRQGTKLEDPKLTYKYYSYEYILQKMFKTTLKSYYWTESESVSNTTGKIETRYSYISGEEHSDEIESGMFDPEMHDPVADFWVDYEFVRLDKAYNDYIGGVNRTDSTPITVVKGNTTEIYYNSVYYFKER